jgi:hypothetical protein
MLKFTASYPDRVTGGHHTVTDRLAHVDSVAAAGSSTAQQR